ncbi:MAG TPA: epoxyqueuosine reductase QueH [Deferrisomatales bacterium]|nr:epoxyqueuosine reductase QueH [Deferrisomatales bacterium]
MKILLHTCCGPCTIVPLRELRGEGAEVFGAYLNPNIQPYTEWQRRLDALEALAAAQELRLLPEQPYEPVEWLRSVVFRERERCRPCYHGRLRGAALLARRGRFDAFTTTLLYSKFQKHDLIAEIAAAVAAEVGVPFLYRDWRGGWADGVEASRAMGLYRQPYCGCIYSEWERYAPRQSRKTRPEPPT